MAEEYYEEPSVANEISGYTKSFQKKTKEKRKEDPAIKDLLTHFREGRVYLGSRVAEKSFKNGKMKKVFVASNSDELTLEKFRHYAEINGVEIVELDMDREELGQKLGKPFLVAFASVLEN